MKYTIKKLNPFKSDIEAKEWMETNCDICKRYDCRVKKSFRVRSIMDVTLKQAEWMGTLDNNLLDKCGKFIEVPPIRKQKDKIDKFIENSF